MSEAAKTTERDHPGVIAPPPLIFGGILLLTLLLDWVVTGPGFALSDTVRLIAGGAFSIAGLALIIAAAIRFQVARTAVQPWRPTTAIVTTGVYRISRNPIYLGMAIVYTGLSLLADSVVALAGLPVAIVIVQYGVIKREERYLEEKFGDSYAAYRRSVRRWI
ncbi:MAG: methyltransferase family protein [Rhodomicrobiaceae bacterium]